MGKRSGGVLLKEQWQASAKKKKDNSSGDNQNETKQPAETEKPVVTDRPDVTPLMVSQRKTGKDGGA